MWLNTMTLESQGKKNEKHDAVFAVAKARI